MLFPRVLRTPSSVVAVVSFFGTACVYPERYINTLAPGDHVVVALTDAGIPDMAPKLGQGVFLVGGEVKSLDQDQLMLAVDKTESTRGVPYGYGYGYPYGYHPEIVHWDGDVVPIPRADVATVRQRKVSAPAVAAVVGAVLLGVGFAVVAHNAHPAKLAPLPQPQPQPFPVTAP
jgi:hypothetical protein